MDPDQILVNFSGEFSYIDRNIYKQTVDSDIAGIQAERDLLEQQMQARLQELHISPQATYPLWCSALTSGPALAQCL
jgi:hypothetical protein